MDVSRHRNILKQFTSQSDSNQVMTEENVNRSKLYMQRWVKWLTIRKIQEDLVAKTHVSEVKIGPSFGCF